ncbi:TetR/AcrR family transcriptional regulator [Micromonospora sp. NPDC005324]|uniref:TetR/AcrR family transcriptional regulator n=1 Tax=Micromonospora sp. NPDC005324 TaxID=3157033 RepID=UPI0033A0904B
MVEKTRRDRLRIATISEIKGCARRLLVTSGVDAVSLRAIARDMGMSAPAIYRYFPSLEALVRSLTADLYDELRERVEQATADAVSDDPIGELLAMSRAFRRWAVGHPHEFTLIFGCPARGLPEPVSLRADADPAGVRLGAAFLAPFVTLAARRALPDPPNALYQQHLGDRLAPLMASYGGLTAEAAYAFLAAWTRLYGLIAMEVFDHLSWAVSEPEALFETELAVLAAHLGRQPGADSTA